MLVRGSNPIWFEVDLTAHAFDDTFYLFVLENDIPYIPATVWQDPDGNVAWTSPIQFYANGTLPNNIYFDPDVVYRLEFRQGNSQSSPLIYLVENYVPGSSGNIPVEGLFTTDNQITNPQFALINFVSPLTLTGISTQVINIAPGWSLNLTGTGNVTLTQVLINSSVVMPTNSSYALRIQLSGSWTNAYLSQRFTQNGILWSGVNVSGSITALSGNPPQTISSILVDSQAHQIAQILPLTTSVTGTFNEFIGDATVDASTDTDLPPTAYIEYQISLPTNADITISSIQLVAGGDGFATPYIQTTIERQIDETFHYYKPKLEFKPIASLLTGWDFPLNPAQFGSSITFTNTVASYVWDQTVCQSVVGTVNVSRASIPKGPLAFTTNNNNEAFYMLQYLQGAEAVNTALTRLSVNFNGYAPAFGLTMRVYLYNGNNSSTIPTLVGGSAATIGTIAANGVFTLNPALSATWSLISSGVQPVAGSPVSVPTSPRNVAFSGFDPTSFYGSTTNFAIVVTFSVPVTNTTIIVNSVSCVPGDIATIPAAQTADEVLRECEFYYQTSFLNTYPLSLAPRQNAGSNSGEYNFTNIIAGSSTNVFAVKFLVPMRTTPLNPPIFYNPVAANALIRNFNTGANYATTALKSNTLNANGFNITGTADAGSSLGDQLGVHWSCDARLGIV